MSLKVRKVSPEDNINLVIQIETKDGESGYYDGQGGLVEIERARIYGNYKYAYASVDEARAFNLFELSDYRFYEVEKQLTVISRVMPKKPKGIRMEGRFEPCPMCDEPEPVVILEEQMYVECQKCSTQGGWSRALAGAGTYWNMRTDDDDINTCPFCGGTYKEMKRGRKLCIACAAEFPEELI